MDTGCCLPHEQVRRARGWLRVYQRDNMRCRTSVAALAEPALLIAVLLIGREMLCTCGWCRGGAAQTGSRLASPPLAAASLCRTGVPGLLLLPGQAFQAGLPLPSLPAAPGLLASGVLAPEAGSCAPRCFVGVFAGWKPQSAPGAVPTSGARAATPAPQVYHRLGSRARRADS